MRRRNRRSNPLSSDAVSILQWVGGLFAVATVGGLAYKAGQATPAAAPAPAPVAAPTATTPAVTTPAPTTTPASIIPTPVLPTTPSPTAITISGAQSLVLQAPANTPQDTIDSI